jgi:hypothetical protein
MTLETIASINDDATASLPVPAPPEISATKTSCATPGNVIARKNANQGRSGRN